MLMIYQCLDYFSKNGYEYETTFALNFNIKKALTDFKKYFFEKDKTKKIAILSALCKRINILIENAQFLFNKIDINNVKWYVQRKLEKIKKYASTYIRQVQHYCRTGHASKNKILSFHLQDIVPVQKGKEHKKYEFGSVWQVGRFDGNFCFGIFNPLDLRFHDTSAFKNIVETIVVQMDNFPKTVSADRGYFSEANFDALDLLGILDQGIHPKGCNQWKITKLESAEKLMNRRAGIEPIIGHLKNVGLGKSRMKTDLGTRLEGARSFISFNIKKLIALM